MLIKENRLRKVIRDIIFETFRPGPGGLGANNASIRTMTNDFNDVPVMNPQDIAADFNEADPAAQIEIMNYWKTMNPGRPFPSHGETILYKNNVNGFTINYIYNKNINEWVDEEYYDEDLIDIDKMF